MVAIPTVRGRMVASISVSSFLSGAYSPTRGLSAEAEKQLAVCARALDRFMGRPATCADLSEELIGRFLADYAAGGRATPTVNSKRRGLLALWRAAADLDLCPAPNGRKIAKRREPVRIPEAWTLAEVERLVAECRRQDGFIGTTQARYWWPALTLTVYATGCRISAMLATVTADVSLGERWLIVRAEASKTNTDQLYWLSDQAVAAIAAIHDQQRELLWAWPFSMTHLWRRFRRIVETAGLHASKKRHDLFHKLRRTTLSYTALGGGMELARRQAGHSDCRITQKHYIDPRILADRSAADVLPVLRV